MNILTVTQYYRPETFRINDLVDGLKERGHNITVLTGLPCYPTGSYYKGYNISSIGRSNVNGINIIRCPIIPRFSGKRWQLTLNYLSFAITSSLFALSLYKHKYEAIFVYEPSPITVGIPAIITSKLLNVPIFFWVQDLWPESLIATKAIKSKIVLMLTRQLVRWIYRHCTKILIQSMAFKDSLNKLGVESEKILYFPNWAENIYQNITNTNKKNEKNINNKFCIMFAGNLGIAQSLETIVKAAKLIKEYSEIQWIILGDGRNKKWLEDAVNKEGLHDTVHLKGFKPLEEIPDYINNADVLLVTLRSEPIFALTIPAKIQSYLASGKPIVASIDGEAARIINESGGGIAVAAEDYIMLAEKIIFMYRLPKEELNRFGICGRNYFKLHFDRNKLLDNLEYWFQEFSSRKSYVTK